MATQTQGLRWSVDRAEVRAIRSGQTKSGEPFARVEMDYWGGSQSMPIEPEEAHRFAAYEGKFVAASGRLNVKENQWGTRVTLTLDAIAEAK